MYSALAQWMSLRLPIKTICKHQSVADVWQQTVACMTTYRPELVFWLKISILLRKW